MIEGELVQPELSFIRIYLNQTLDSAEDLNLIIAQKSVVANEDLPPMIIHSGTKRGARDAIEVVRKAQGQPANASNVNRKCIRRYDSVTSKNDEVKDAREYREGKYSIISATSAIGLGKNWTRVKIVVIMGDMEPSDSNQMAGTAGRGNPDGLVVLFVHSNVP